MKSIILLLVLASQLGTREAYKVRNILVVIDTDRLEKDYHNETRSLDPEKPLIKKLHQKENVGSMNGVNSFSHEKNKKNDNTITINGKVVNPEEYGPSNENGWNFSGVKIMNNKIVDPGPLNGVPMRWIQNKYR
uniref:Uncharacterized protein n=1 Tax=Cacopsylla melanoneura TaxID=428564 RepID=A0A8D8XQZ1_9HEMI